MCIKFKNQLTVLFVYSGNNKFSIAPFILSQAEAIGKQINVKYYPIIGKGLMNYIRHTNKLKNYIRNNNIDIVHSHYVLTGIVAKISIMGRIPVVQSFMGTDVYGDINEKGERLFSTYFYMLLSQVIQPFLDAIIVKSKNIEKYIFMKKKCSVIPNGVNIKLIKPQDKSECRSILHLNMNNKLVLFLGDTSEKIKNYRLALESVKMLNDDLIKLISPYPVQHKEVVHWLNAADMLICTSYIEGSPNVIKEAMACNCPIVATDVGDVKEVIGNTEGCFITSYTPEDIAEKIKMAIKFGKRTNGRQRIIELGLDSDTVAKKIVKIYNKILIKNL